MKKVLFLLPFYVFLFSCHQETTNPNEGNKNDSVASKNSLMESAIAADDKKACDPFVDVAYWKIPNADAEAMIADTTCPTCDPKYNTSKIKSPRNRILDKLICRYGMLNVTIVEARYKTDEDVARYCEKRGIDPASDKGKVKNYKTWIIKVTPGGSTLLTDPEYYDFVTICPPPDPPC